MTTFTTLSNTTLSQDKPLTQSVARALRDNPVAIGEGDATAPVSEVKSIRNAAVSATTTAGSGFTLSNGAIVPFSVEEFDREGWYDNSTYKFTPLKSGLYLVNCYVAQGTGGTATGASFRVLKNGAATGPISLIAAANVASDSMTVLIYLNGTTDYLQVQVSYSGGSLTAAGGSTNYFRAAHIGYVP